MESLEKIKKEYINTQTPSHFSQSGWETLQSKLDVQAKYNSHFPPYKMASFTLIAILLLGSILTTAQAAKPGSLLYPLKIVSDDTKAKISGDYDTAIKHRAQDVIDSQASQENFDQAAQQYIQTLQKLQQPKNQKNEQALKTTLKEQEQKFRQVQYKDRISQERLREIIRETRKAQGEVEGAKDDWQHNENRRNNDN